MKRALCYFAFVFAVFAGTVGTARAQSNVTYYYPQAATPYYNNGSGISSSTMGTAADPAVQSAMGQVAAGGQQTANAPLFNQYGQPVSLSGMQMPVQQQEPKKKYKYNKRGSIFDGAMMPQRTFNNIPYPY